MDSENDEAHSTPPGSPGGHFPNFKIPVSIFIVSMVATMLPRMLSKSRFIRKYFGYVTVFTAGLQLSTILVDLIPHMASGHHDHHDHSHHHGHDASEFYPYIASGLCFLSLLAIDSIFLHSDKHTHGNSAAGAHHSHDGTAEQDNPQGDSRACEHTHGNKTACSHTHGEDQGCHDTVGTCNTSVIAESKTKTEGILFLLAISIHSFFEGLAEIADVKHLPLLVGLFFHKMLESFAIGASVLNSVFSTSTKILLLVIYSSLTPLAIFVKDMEFFAKSAVVQRWFDALCIGSLMFVVFFEMIGHSFHGGKNMTKKMGIITTGYLLGCGSIVLAHAKTR